MGKHTLVLSALVAGVAAMAIPGVAAGAGPEGELATALAGAAEVPTKGPAAGRGTAEITFGGERVCWEIAVQGTDRPLAAHIHKGGARAAGPVVVPLGAAFKAKGCGTVPDATANAILGNPAGYYVNVHTKRFQAGAVRGQLAAKVDLQTELTGAAEVPDQGPASGRGTAGVTLAGNLVCWEITVGGTDRPLAAHIHKGGAAVAGPVVVPLGAAFARKGCGAAPAAVVKAIAANPDGYYVNVHTKRFQGGAVRGQLAAAVKTTAGARSGGGSSAPSY